MNLLLTISVLGVSLGEFKKENYWIFKFYETNCFIGESLFELKSFVKSFSKYVNSVFDSIKFFVGQHMCISQLN